VQGNLVLYMTSDSRVADIVIGPDCCNELSFTRPHPPNPLRNSRKHTSLLHRLAPCFLLGLENTIQLLLHLGDKFACSPRRDSFLEELVHLGHGAADIQLRNPI
jgi:hypothetical protein